MTLGGVKNTVSNEPMITDPKWNRNIDLNPVHKGASNWDFSL